MNVICYPGVTSVHNYDCVLYRMVRLLFTLPARKDMDQLLNYYFKQNTQMSISVRRYDTNTIAYIAIGSVHIHVHVYMYVYNIVWMYIYKTTMLMCTCTCMCNCMYSRCHNKVSVPFLLPFRFLLFYRGVTIFCYRLSAFTTVPFYRAV